jgi:NAD+-dependent protein deacetylase SIR2
MRTVSVEALEREDALLRRLRGVRRVVCVVGAGLSTSSGIPDFRSAGGLYEHVRDKYHLRQGADLFDANLFRVRAPEGPRLRGHAC